MRTALLVEYDGSQYHGWQAQAGLKTVQGVLEQALSKVADNEIGVVAAGRTDTGVHATHQIVHFDCDKRRTMQAWIHGVNSFLPKDVCIRWAKEMPENFHARYSALSRRYHYVIFNAAVRPALFRSYMTWQYRQLNVHAMQEAAQHLLGEQDFTSFRSIDCQSKTPKRHIYRMQVTRRESMVVIDVTANAFLHHMVRNIAGVLMTIGTEKKPVPWVKEVLEAKDRRLGAETAPPYGLYLVGVAYPKEFGISRTYTNSHWTFDLRNHHDHK
ncbi:MAG: tRNA pseudouridine(38-40) synthase TruA [Legionella sp.]|nr:tRNA pseudouridine(38-40) synthase TruA [Legionella sp.]